MEERKERFADTTSPWESYEIWQISNDSELRDFLFMRWEFMQKIGVTPSPSGYTKVYQGEILESEPAKNTENVLDFLFFQFNTHHPKGYKGHSLSISDVIVLNKKDTKEAYFVDDIGFKLIENWSV